MIGGPPASAFIAGPELPKQVLVKGVLRMQETHPAGIAAILPAALVGGSLAGAIDIGYAIAANLAKVPPGRVLQSVASGLLGRSAFEGGPATAVLGLALHFLMTIVMAVIFILVARASAPVRNNLVAAGLLYGCAIYFVMRWVVVPLSRFPGDLRALHPLELAFHAVGVGLVIALTARHFGALDLTMARRAHVEPSTSKGL